MTAVFVTSTGTDIGKTHVTAGLIRHWRAAGVRARAFKPLLSDFSPAKAEASDAGRLLRAMGESCTPKALDRITPWRFAAALSPDMAAAREGRRVDFAALVDFSRQACAAPGLTLIEGVGGVMVPLDDRHTVLDWMAALGLPVLLVAGTYLGTISHILTAVAVLRQRGLTTAAVALNDSGDEAVPHEETIAAVRRFLPDIPLTLVPRRPDAETAPTADFAVLAAQLPHSDA